MHTCNELICEFSEIDNLLLFNCGMVYDTEFEAYYCYCEGCECDQLVGKVYDICDSCTHRECLDCYTCSYSNTNRKEYECFMCGEPDYI